MEEADGWKTYPIVAEASKADMECAIRCSQDNDCLSRGLPKGLYKQDQKSIDLALETNKKKKRHKKNRQKKKRQKKKR